LEQACLDSIYFGYLNEHGLIFTNVRHLPHPVDFNGVLNFSAVQRIGPFYIRNKYLGLKMWILLAEIWICNSKGIHFETSNEERNHQSITGLLWQWVYHGMIAQP